MICKIYTLNSTTFLFHKLQWCYFKMILNIQSISFPSLHIHKCDMRKWEVLLVTLSIHKRKWELSISLECAICIVSHGVSVSTLMSLQPTQLHHPEKLKFFYIFPSCAYIFHFTSILRYKAIDDSRWVIEWEKKKLFRFVFRAPIAWK